MFRFALAIVLIGGTAMAQHCTIQSLVGTYMLTYQGSLAMPSPDGSVSFAPGALLGVASIDNSGNITGAGMISVAGQLLEWSIDSGELDVTASCTGTLTTRGTYKGSALPMLETDRIVVLKEDHEIHAMAYQITMPAVPAILGVWKRISAMPNDAVW